MIICSYVDDKVKKRINNQDTSIITFLDQDLKYTDNQVSLNELSKIGNFIDYFQGDKFLLDILNRIKKDLIINFSFGLELYRLVEMNFLTEFHQRLNILNYIVHNSNSSKIYMFKKDDLLQKILYANGFKIIKCWSRKWIITQILSILYNIYAFMYVKIVSVSSKKIRFIHDNHINKFFIYYFGKEVRAQEFLEGVYNLNYLIPGFEILNIKYLLKRIKTVNVLKLKLHKNKTKFNLFSEIINSSINLISKKKIKFPLPISKREFYIINTLLLEMNRLNKLKGVVVSQTVGGMERFIVEATSSKLFKIEISHGFPGFLGLHDPIPVNYYSQYQSLSKLLIYGRGDEKFYIENFKVIRKSQLVKVGNPIFDNYLNQKSSVNVEGYLILLILQPNDTGLDRINLNVKYFLEVIKKFNLNGVIKCHQRQDEDELRYVKHLINIADKNKSVRVLFDLDYLELQSKKLIILSPDSTYSLELLFFKKIIVFLDMGNQKRNIRLDKFNYAVSIENISELIIEIEFILKNYDSYLKQRLANWEITAKYFTSYKDEIDFTFSKAMLEVLANL